MRLEKSDTRYLQGLSIMLIVLHNLVHNLKPLPSQNEFNFSIVKAQGLFDILLNEPGDLIRALLSYYGHYGVKVFVFLSAYGLTRVYLNNQVEYWPYIKRHVGKIYAAFMIVVVVWMLTEWVVNGVSVIQLISQHLTALSLKFMAVNYPGYALAPVGPWWYIPVVIQLYVLFPLLLSLSKRHGAHVLLWISLGCLVVLAVVDKKILFFNALGHIPEFSLGIYLGLKKGFRIGWGWLVVAIVVFIAGHFNQYLWLFSGLSIITMTLFIHQFNQRLWGKSWLIPMGALSVYLFLINGFVRTPLLPLLKAQDSGTVVLLLAVLMLMFNVVLAALISSIKKALTRR